MMKASVLKETKRLCVSDIRRYMWFVLLLGAIWVNALYHKTPLQTNMDYCVDKGNVASYYITANKVTINCHSGESTTFTLDVGIKKIFLSVNQETYVQRPMVAKN